MRNKFGLILFIWLILAPIPSFALSLDQAKAQGKVGEKPDGYLGVVVGSPDVDQLVSKTNAERRRTYQEIAKKNGTTLATVEALAGKKALENTPGGQWVLTPAGQWRKK